MSAKSCEVNLKVIFEKFNVSFYFKDKTNCGKNIDVEFIGSLRDEQPLAINKLLQYDSGILCGTTAFGET